MRPLVADSCWFPMARVDDSVIWEGQKLLTDTPEQGCVIPAGEVRGTDAFMEKDVPADEETLVCAVETDAAGGVARQEENAEPVLTQQYGLTGSQEDEFSAIVVEGHSPVPAHYRRGIEDGQLFFVEMEG